VAAVAAAIITADTIGKEYKRKVSCLVQE